MIILILQFNALDKEERKIEVQLKSNISGLTALRGAQCNFYSNNRFWLSCVYLRKV